MARQAERDLVRKAKMAVEAEAALLAEEVEEARRKEAQAEKVGGRGSGKVQRDQGRLGVGRHTGRQNGDIGGGEATAEEAATPADASPYPHGTLPSPAWLDVAHSSPHILLVLHVPFHQRAEALGQGASEEEG